MKNAGGKAGSKKEKEKYSEKFSCTQWKENENLFFNASIQKLLPVQLYYFLLTEPNGQIVIKPVVMKLWTIFGDSFTPDIFTDAFQIGIAWHPIGEEDFNNYQGEGLPFFEDEMRVISFDDIIDMNYQYIDSKSNEWLVKNVNSLHHHGNYWKSKGPKNSEKIQNLHSNDLYCLVSLVSKFDYKIQILACCLHDYNDCLLALQHLLLFLNYRLKLNQVSNKENSVALGDSSIHQCCAAQAFNLVFD
jgi:hypothetical protein